MKIFTKFVIFLVFATIGFIPFIFSSNIEADAAVVEVFDTSDQLQTYINNLEDGGEIAIKGNTVITSTVVIKKNLTIRFAGKSEIIRQGNASTYFPMFKINSGVSVSIDAVSYDVAFDGALVGHGVENDLPGSSQMNSIFWNQGHLDINGGNGNVTIRNNIAYEGAGIYNDTTGEVFVVHCTLTNLYARDGGAFYNKNIFEIQKCPTGVFNNKAFNNGGFGYSAGLAQ